MNTALRQALAETGVDIDDAGMRVLILNATGRVPFPDGHADTIEARGFNFVVLDRSGHPGHFGKVRPRQASSLRWDTEVRTALRRDPQLAAVVPEAHFRAADGFLLQVAPFLHGRTLTGDATRLHADAWWAITGRVLAAAEHMSDVAPALLPSLAEAPPVDPSALAVPHLDALAAAGVTPERLGSLRRLLQLAEPVRRRVQYGDLWPGNVVRHGAQLWMLDYEVFGAIGVPLYDVCHFLRTSWGLRHLYAGSGTWMGHLGRGTAEARAEQQVIRACAEGAGLTRPAVSACAAYYLVDFAGRLLARGAAHAAPFVAEVETAADAAGAGVPLADLLLGSAG